MQNQYFVNIPVDGHIYVKKKNDKKFRNPPESSKSTQQLPLMSHFTKQPTGEKQQLPPTGDDLHVPTANHFKKSKYEPTTNNQTGHQPTQPKTNQRMPNNQANIQPIQQPKVSPTKNQ